MAGLGRRIGLAARVETRRPASAVAFAAGIGTGGAAATWSLLPEVPGGLDADLAAGLESGAAVLIGSWLAAAAVGDLPQGVLSAPRGRLGRAAAAAEAMAWAAVRAVPCLIGCGIGVAAAIAVAAGVGWEPVRHAGLLVFAITATCSTAAGLRAAGGRGSEPATAAVLVATGVAAVCWTGLPATWQTTPRLAIGWLLVGALVVGGMAWVARDERRVAMRARGRTAWLWPLPSQGRLRPVLTVVVMAASLAAMAVLLVPQPPQAARYAVLSAAAMIALAVPQMTLADGVVDRSGWAMVLQPPALRAPGKPFTAPMFPPPGRIGFGHAAIVAWPLVVAGGLACRRAEHLIAMAAAAAVLFGIAALASLASRAVRRGGGAAETAQAVVLGSFAVMAAWLFPVLLRVFSPLAMSHP